MYVPEKYFPVPQINRLPVQLLSNCVHSSITFLNIEIPGNVGELERTVSKIGFLRQFRHHFRMDQVRGKMVYRIDQRSKHASYLLFVVSRREDGTYLLSGKSAMTTLNLSKVVIFFLSLSQYYGVTLR